MSKTGISRPGAMQMVVSAALMVVAAIGPLMLAATRPGQEWFMFLTGFPALASAIASVLVLFFYFFGFLRYCASKGYSKWLGFWLILANAPGFIVLLLLPDITASQTDKLHASGGTPETSPI